MEKFRFLEIKCIDEETGKTVHIEDTTKSNPHMIFYRSDDVDALLSDVAKLVESAKAYAEMTVKVLDGRSDKIEAMQVASDLRQAIAAVESRMKEV